MSDTENYLILFGDLVGSTEVAVEVTPAFYAQTYSASYRWAVNRAFEFIKNKKVYPKQKFKSRISKHELAGDEVFSFTRLGEPRSGDALQDTVASAVSFAWVTKMYWLASPYNLRRMICKQFPRDIAVGIHIGPATYVPVAAGKRDIASLHINLAKRIEGEARKGSESRIFASYEVHELLNQWCRRAEQAERDDRSYLSFTKFEMREVPELVKGISKRVQLLELVWPRFNDVNLEYLLVQLAKTTEAEEVASQKAARILAETFFASDGNPFAADKTGNLLVITDLRGADTVKGYISLWFDAVAELNRLFFDECWLVLNCYLMSCAMLRHKAVKASDRARYVAITNGVWKRFKDLMELREDRGRPTGCCI